MSTREELKQLLVPIRKAWAAKIRGEMSETQSKDRRDKPAKGPIWVSRSRIPAAPEQDMPQLISKAIAHLAPRGEQVQHDSPPPAEIGGEWLATRRNVDKSAKEPEVSEAEKYRLLCKDVDETKPVVLFFHGGNMIFGGPVPYRHLLSQLSAVSGVRFFTPAYRLAPKNIFPSALTDALSAYLYLLSAPPGSFHKPIPASKIIISGDSAGCSLVFALTKLLLTAKELGITSVRYHGKSVPLDLPAGITAFCPYTDATLSLPSERLNVETDVFVGTLVNYANQPSKYSEALDWPSSPPRHDFAGYQSALDHPLMSPTAVTSWRGAPPMFICAGDHERPVDNAKVIAQRAHESGVTVQYNLFEEMPHIWFIFLPKIPASQKCFQNWAAAVECIATRSCTSRAVNVNPWTLQEIEVNMSELSWFPLDHVPKLMRMEKMSRQPVLLPPSKL